MSEPLRFHGQATINIHIMKFISINTHILGLHLAIIPLALVGYEMIIANSALHALLAGIISYPTRASGILVFINNTKKILLDLYFALQDHRTTRRQVNGRYFSGMV